jgi:hypothetical protein
MRTVLILLTSVVLMGCAPAQSQEDSSVLILSGHANIGFNKQEFQECNGRMHWISNPDSVVNYADKEIRPTIQIVGKLRAANSLARANGFQSEIYVTSAMLVRLEQACM